MSEGTIAVIVAAFGLITGLGASISAFLLARRMQPSQIATAAAANESTNAATVTTLNAAVAESTRQ